MKKIFLVFLVLLAAFAASFGQSDGEKPTLFRQPTISKTNIVFSYAGDLWSVARTGGDDIASEAVKNHIKQLVSTENAKNPYSDQKIVELLKKGGIDIARRTVAKYREQLGILSSSKRKQVF